jgi:hypothetical protein
MSTGMRSEPALDELGRDEAQQPEDNEHEPPRLGPLGSVVVARLLGAFVLLHGQLSVRSAVDR